MSRKVSRFYVAVLLALVLGTTDSPQAAAKVRLGGVVVNGAYAHSPFYSPFFAPYCYAFWCGPYWWPYGYYADPGIGHYDGTDSGKVVLQNAEREGEVFIDGAYAGRAGDLKSLRLRPGVYEIEVRSSQNKFQQRIYVLSGKTLKLDIRRH